MDLTPREKLKLRLAIGMMGDRELVDILKVETILSLDAALETSSLDSIHSTI